MKRKIKYLFFSLFLITKAVAQREFAPIGAEWYFSKVEDWNPPDEGYVKFSVIKDTFINDIPARVIERLYYTSYGEINRFTDEYIHQSGDTIFYFREGEFRVLYNFSLAKGDTMTFYANGSNPCNNEDNFGTVIIDSVFIQTINEIDLKTYLCSPTENSPWDYYKVVEGVGHYGGFYPQFNNTCGIVDFLYDIGQLRCYTDDDLNLINNWDGPCDTLIDYLGNINIYQINNGIKIYPIPANQLIYIKFDNPYEGVKHIEIYRLNGQSILKERIHETFYSLNISSFLPGVYIIKIVSGSDSIPIQKLIKL